MIAILLCGGSLFAGLLLLLSLCFCCVVVVGVPVCCLVFLFIAAMFFAIIGWLGGRLSK